MAGRFQHIAAEQDAVGGDAEGQQRKLVVAAAQRAGLRAVDVCPGLLLPAEVDQATDIQAGAYLFIERMIGARLGQALEQLIAARNVIPVQGNRGLDQVDLRRPVRLTAGHLFERSHPDFRLAGEHRQQAGPGTLQQHVGVLGQTLQRYAIQPAHELTEIADVVMRRLVALKQPDQFAEVVAEHGVAGGFVDQPGLFEPVRGTQVQLRPVDVRCGQALQEELGEQRMQPVPLLLALHVDRQDEQVMRFDRGDQLGRLGHLADMRRHFRVEAAQDGDSLQKAGDLGRQTVDHVLRQVVAQPAVVRQQAVDLQALARVGLQRDRHQLQADGPAIGAVVNGVGQLQVDGVVQVGLQEGQ
ncbi:hypothetical protein D9M69_430730 [compost metagenome]